MQWVTQHSPVGWSRGGLTLCEVPASPCPHFPTCKGGRPHGPCRGLGDPGYSRTQRSCGGRATAKTKAACSAHPASCRSHLWLGPLPGARPHAGAGLGTEPRGGGGQGGMGARLCPPPASLPSWRATVRALMELPASARRPPCAGVGDRFGARGQRRAPVPGGRVCPGQGRLFWARVSWVGCPVSLPAPHCLQGGVSPPGVQQVLGQRWGRGVGGRETLDRGLSLLVKPRGSPAFFTCSVWHQMALSC